MISRSFKILVMFAVLGAAIFVISDTNAAGRLVKGSQSAVYYLPGDGTRYAYPNEAVFFSWYHDFSEVERITDIQLAYYPIGGVITYRPGSRLVKITTDPKVYSVTSGSILRWITTEEIARELYGSDWASKIDDIPDSFFGHYQIGEPILSASVTPAPVVNPVSSNDDNSSGASLDISLAASPVSSLVARGTDGFVPAVSFTFKNSLSRSININALTVTGYIDENEGNADFSIGMDEDNGSYIFLNNVVSKVVLVDSTTNSVVASSMVGTNGLVKFSNFVWSVPPESSAELALRVQVNADAPFELGNDRFAFDIAHSSDMVAAAADTSSISVSGISPNHSVAPLVYLTVVDSGTLTISNPTLASSKILITGSSSNPIYSVGFSADKIENIVVENLSFKIVNPEARRNIRSAQITYLSDGTSVEKSGLVNADDILFKNLGLIIPKGGMISVTLSVDLYSLQLGSMSGDELSVDFDDDLFFATGTVSNYIYAGADSHGKTIDRSVSSAIYVVKNNEPVFSLVSGSSAATESRADNTEAFKFTILSVGEGTPEIKKLTFKILPSDVATSHGSVASDNDLLEKLADIDGDSRDDDDIVELFDSETGETYGESSDGRVRYEIYDASLKVIDATPAGLDTAAGDYGLVVYEFNEPIKALKTPREYSLLLDTRGLEIGTKNIKISLLGGSDLVWSDGFLGSDNETGAVLSGLPLNGPTINFK